MKMTLFAVLALAASLYAGGSPPAAQEQADRDAILALMHATWDRPQAPLDAGPVVIEGDHAVADWSQADKGGRALLKKADGTWVTVLCAGDGIRTAAGLHEAGLPRSEATRLATKLAAAERTVPKQRLARMATFAGVVRMPPQAGTGGAHP